MKAEAAGKERKPADPATENLSPTDYCDGHQPVATTISH